MVITHGSYDLLMSVTAISSQTRYEFSQISKRENILSCYSLQNEGFPNVSIYSNVLNMLNKIMHFMYKIIFNNMISTRLKLPQTLVSKII